MACVVNFISCNKVDTFEILLIILDLKSFLNSSLPHPIIKLYIIEIILNHSIIHFGVGLIAQFSRFIFSLLQSCKRGSLCLKWTAWYFTFISAIGEGVFKVAALWLLFDHFFFHRVKNNFDLVYQICAYWEV